jgi:hypothetical protein
MRKTLWILAATLIFGSAAWADSACASGKLSTYLGGGFSCYIDNLDFSNWSYTPGGTTFIDASTIDVTPIPTLLDEGFKFNPAMNVNNFPLGPGFPDLREDVLIGFTVTTRDNSKTLHDLSIYFNAGRADPGTGSASFTETYDYTPCASCPKNFSVTNPPPDLFEHLVLANLTNSLSITKDVVADTGSGGAGGSAFVSDFRNQFSQVVPEPAYTALLTAGLLGLGWLRKRRQSQV